MKANPSLYQVDVRDWLYRIGEKIGRPATLDDVSDAELERLSHLGFDWVWLLGIWQLGEAGANVSRSTPEWRSGYATSLPDVQPDDIAGSMFAVCAFKAHKDYGGAPALQRIRARLRQHGIRLMLDFVPNHTAIDCSWVRTHPDYYVAATEEILQADPRNYTRVETDHGPMILAYGRDPNFPGWSDALQLNYGNPALQDSMVHELERIATMCDGVRCDMAMLELPEVFKRTWNIDIAPFWPKAIPAARKQNREFILMAEVYWGLEWQLQQLGFDYTYDKELYDRIVHKDAASVRGHLTASADYQHKSVRFLENHDEPRAAVVFDRDKHKAAAILTYLVQGMRFFHDGQLQGFRHQPSNHLRRRCTETPNQDLAAFYDKLLDLLDDPIYQGKWTVLDVEPTSEQNTLICFAWQDGQGSLTVVAVNFAPQAASGKAMLPAGSIRADFTIQSSSDEASNIAPLEASLVFELPPWGYTILRSQSTS